MAAARSPPASDPANSQFFGIHPAEAAGISAGVGCSRRQPHPHARRQRDHPRRAPRMRRNARASTCWSTRTTLPPGKLISTVRDGDGPGGDGGGDGRVPSAGSDRRAGGPARKARWPRLRHLGGEQAVADLSAPREDQTAIGTVPGRDVADRGTLFVGLGHNAQLLRRAPATPPLPARDDLDRAVHDLKPSLKVSSIPTRTPTSEGGDHRTLTVG